MTKESVRTHVFRDRVRAYHKEHGTVGFEHRQGVDSVQVISWANGQTNIAEFEVEAIPALIEVLQRAYDTKTRPNAFSCYAFEKKPEGDRVEQYL